MTSRTNHIKSPFLAGFFGLIPGLGHLYAGNMVKGLMVGALLVLSLCICFSVQQKSHSMNIYQSSSSHEVKVYMYKSFDGNPFNQFSSFNPISLLGLFFFIPILIVYSIADSVVSVLQHNRQILFGSEHIHPPRLQQMEWNNPEQDILRQGARERGMPI